MGANCAKCCICYCFKFMECPSCCRCPSQIRSCCEGVCECADCCDVEDEDMAAVLQERPRPRSGEASYKYENGDEYVGHWKNGLRHGKGELVKADGSRQKGYFDDDEYVGEHPVQHLQPVGTRETFEEHQD